MWSFLNKAGGLASICALTGGSVWYFFTVESRVSGLELQIQTLSGGVAAISVDAADGSGRIQGVNPILAKCASLADRYVEAHENGRFATVAPKVEKLMGRLGCFVDK